MSEAPVVQPAAAVVMGRKGRVGVALPLTWLYKFTTIVVTLLVGLLSLALWGVSLIWHELCWATFICVIIRGIRRTIAAYNEGRNS